MSKHDENYANSLTSCLKRFTSVSTFLQVHPLACDLNVMKIGADKKLNCFKTGWTSSSKQNQQSKRLKLDNLKTIMVTPKRATSAALPIIWAWRWVKWQTEQPEIFTRDNKWSPEQRRTTGHDEPFLSPNRHDHRTGKSHYNHNFFGTFGMLTFDVLLQIMTIPITILNLQEECFLFKHDPLQSPHEVLTFRAQGLGVLIHHVSEPKKLALPSVGILLLASQTYVARDEVWSQLSQHNRQEHDLWGATVALWLDSPGQGTSLACAGRRPELGSC